MLQKQQSISKKNNFAEYFLIEFTKEILKNYSPNLKNKKPIQEKFIPQKKQDFISKPLKKAFIKKHFPMQKPMPIKKRIIPKKITIPEIRLPPRFQYLKPTPTKQNIGTGIQQFDQMIQNPSITIIECYGPNIPLKIRTRTGGIKNTNTQLTKKEIDTIIQIFSEKTKIPIQEGIYNVTAGGLILSAVISDVTGTRFIIKKIIPQKRFPQRHVPIRKLF